MANKIVKNLPYFTEEGALVQEQVAFIKVGKKTKETTEVVTIIPNIWEDLKDSSANKKWETNDKKNYFYYSVEVSKIGDDGYTTQMIEAPSPSLEVFRNDDGEYDWGDSDWSEFWKAKFEKSGEADLGITPKEVVYPEARVVKFEDGEDKTVVYEKSTVKRPTDTTIETLINTLF